MPSYDLLLGRIVRCARVQVLRVKTIAPHHFLVNPLLFYFAFRPILEQRVGYLSVQVLYPKHLFRTVFGGASVQYIHLTR